MIGRPLEVLDFAPQGENNAGYDIASALGATAANVAMEDLVSRRGRALTGQAIPSVKLGNDEPSGLLFFDGQQVIDFPVLEGIPLPPVDGVEISRDDRIRLASIYVDQALQGQKYTFHFVSGDGRTIDSRSMYAYRVFHNMRWVLYGLLAVFLLVGFFERPPWCWSSSTCSCNLVTEPGGFQCIPVPRSMMPLLPNQAALAVELVACIGLLLLDTGVKLFFLRPRKWLFSWESVKACLYIIAIVDDLVSFGVARNWRVAPWIRPFILTFLNFNTRRAVFSSLFIFYLVVDIILLIFVLLILFSWMGLIIWQGTPGSGIYFPDYLIALRELHVALTTANFPDIMVPAYTQSSFAILFYLAFYALGLFFLFPYALASIYNGYKDQLAKEAGEFRRNRRNMLNAAFYALDETKGLWVVADNTFFFFLLALLLLFFFFLNGILPCYFFFSPSHQIEICR